MLEPNQGLSIEQAVSFLQRYYALSDFYRFHPTKIFQLLKYNVLFRKSLELFFIRIKLNLYTFTKSQIFLFNQ